MKTHNEAKTFGILFSLFLGVLLVSCGGNKLVDQALDRDEEFLNKVEQLADRMEKGELTGEWFFNYMNDIYEEFPQLPVEFEDGTVSKSQHKRAQQLEARKVQLEKRLVTLGFSGDEEGRYPLRYAISSLEPKNEINRRLDKGELIFNDMEQLLKQYEQGFLSETQVMEEMETMMAEIEVFAEDEEIDPSSLTEKQLERIELIEDWISGWEYRLENLY